MRADPVRRSVAAMTVRVRLIFVLIAAVLAVIAAPALASPADEVAAGREVAQRLQAGATSCNKLSDADFEHLGEYVMERMLGSRATHRAMNDRMTAMMGDANTERMHELMGRRYAGCGTQGAGARDDGTGHDGRRRRRWFGRRLGRDDGVRRLCVDARRRLAAHEPDGLAASGQPVDGAGDDVPDRWLEHRRGACRRAWRTGSRRPRDVRGAQASVATSSLARTGSDLVADDGPREDARPAV